MTRTLCSTAAAVAILASLAACGHHAHRGHPGAGASGAAAVAQMHTAAGQPAGTAHLSETTGGVEIHVSVEGLSPGRHGFHIHTNGACAPGPDAATGQTVAFGAAGGHFDPGEARQHGRPGDSPQRAHAGELPNIEVGSDGKGSLRYLNQHVSLTRQPFSVLGRSLVVHQNPDDYSTNPAGNSGPRVLCGVVQTAKPQ